MSQLTREIIQIEDLHYTYPQSDEPALKGVSLTIREGEIVTLMGHTGCGKSTLCLTLNGIIPHAIGGELEGKVVVDGLNVLEHGIPELASRVGMVFQDPETQLFCASVRSEVAFGPENLAIPREEILERVKWALEATRLTGYEDREPTRLSGGEKQQVALASALAMRPKILVLDEPTSELDPAGTKRIFSLIKEMNEKYKITFLIIEHKEGMIHMSDRVILMKDGKIVCQGRPDEVFSRAEAVRESRVRPPEVAQIFYKLKERGLYSGRIPLTVGEGARILRELLSRAKDVEVRPPATPTRPETAPVIRVENVWYRYRNGPEALRGVTLDIRDGEFVAIIGRNGAGKTTLAKHFNGLLKPVEGRVLVDGVDTRDALVTELAMRVGYVFQNPDHQFFCFSVEEEVAFGPRNLGLSEEEVKQRVDEALRTVGLEKMRDRHPFTLSRGQRQRLAVASVLAMHPKVIVLDEPTTGQDEVAINQIMMLVDKLRKAGKTIVMVTHDMSIVAKYAERTVVMCRGQVLLDGPTREVFMRPDILAESNVEPPPTAKLARELVDLGIPPSVMTVDEMVEVVAQKLAG